VELSFELLQSHRSGERSWESCTAEVGQCWTQNAPVQCLAERQNCHQQHVSGIFRHIHQLWHIRRSLSTESATTFVHAFVTSRIDYCYVFFVGAPKSVAGKVQRVLNAAAQVVSGTRKFDHDLMQLPIFIGLTCLSSSSTNYVWWCADARTALLHSIWRYAGHQSLRPHHDSIFVRLLAINWHCRHIGRPHMAVGRLLTLVCRRGTHCQNVYVTPVLVLLFLAVFWKHSSSQSTSVSSVPRTYKCLADSSFSVAGPTAWNSLPVDFRRTSTYSSFCGRLKTFLFSKFYSQWHCILFTAFFVSYFYC